MIRTGRNSYRLSYDDFFSTGIWVMLRIYLFPALIFALFFLAGQDEGIAFQSASGPLAELQRALDLPSLAEASGGARFIRP